MGKRCLSVLVSLLATAAVGASPAVASTLTVNTTFDDANPHDGLCSLRDAIAAVDSPGSQAGACAPAAFGPNTIVLAANQYTLSSPNGELNIASTVRDLTITGAGEKQSTIDASNLSDRALQIAAGATVTISNLTINGGHAQPGSPGAAVTSGTAPSGGPGANGGGIMNQGTLTVLDAAITNSQAGVGGSGGSTGTSTNPAVVGGQGGPGGQGGGIYNTGSLTLTGATLTGNQGGAGGAGGLGGQDSGANPSGAGGAGGPGGAGGGVASGGGSLTITGTTINGNAAGAGGSGALGGPAGSVSGASGGVGGNGGLGADGGGIWISGGGLSVTNSTIASNTAGAGGAAGNGGIGSSDAGGNGATGGNGGNGGGVAAAASGTLLNVTLAGNRGGQGGSAGSGGSGSPNGSAGSVGSAGTTGGAIGEGAAKITLQNSLLDLNVGNCGGSIGDGGHNLSFGDSSCPAGFLSGNPDLGALQDNGGPSETIGLQSGSAAIGQAASCPTADERGVPRSNPCDIGAYEVAAPVAVTGAATSVSYTGGVLTATVTPNSGNATVYFEYGKTKLGKPVTAVQHLDGVTAVTVKAKLTGLKPNTVYYYRITATSSDGAATGAWVSFRTTGNPVISALRLTPRSLKTSGTISYRDSGVATTTFALLRCVEQAGSRCKRYRQVRSFKHQDIAGRDHARFSVRGLAKGTYKLEATPRAGKLKGKTVTVTFTVRQ